MNQTMMRNQIINNKKSRGRHASQTPAPIARLKGESEVSLDVWKYFADEKERKKELERNFELQMQSIIHRYSQFNNGELDKAVENRKKAY